jgi:mRNA-degrading endonuclease toxin of MazEF toxin-antitoxin module
VGHPGARKRQADAPALDWQAVKQRKTRPGLAIIRRMLNHRASRTLPVPIRDDTVQQAESGGDIALRNGGFKVNGRGHVMILSWISG